MGAAPFPCTDAFFLSGLGDALLPLSVLKRFKLLRQMILTKCGTLLLTFMFLD